MSNVIFRRRGDTWALLCLSGMDLEPLMDYPPSKEKELVALGESERFNLIFDEYRKAKDITRERILLETMASILPKVNKVIADKEVGGNVLPFLPLGAALSEINK